LEINMENEEKERGEVRDVSTIELEGVARHLQ
jgi:hypothetical protein